MGRVIAVSAALCLLFCLTGCGKAVNRAAGFVQRKIWKSPETEAMATPPERDQGFRNWRRVPLKHPYLLLLSGLSAPGSLGRLNDGNPQEPIESAKLIGGCGNIVRLYWNDELVVFDRAGGQYGVLTFEDEVCRLFPTEEARTAFLNQYHPPVKIEMRSPEYYYNQFEKKLLK